MTVKAVIFDFDGVLAESVNVKTDAFARLFEHEGPEVVRKVVEYHTAHGGVSRFEKFRHIYREFLRRPLGDDEFRSLCERFERLVVDGVVNAPEVAGFSKCLKILRGKARLFIVSGTPEEEMRLIARRRGIAEYFEGIYGSPETKGALIRKVLADCGIAPSEAVFFGDSTTDYEAAVETGVRFVARVTPETERLWAGKNVEAITDLTGCARLLGLA